MKFTFDFRFLLITEDWWLWPNHQLQERRCTNTTRSSSDTVGGVARSHHRYEVHIRLPFSAHHWGLVAMTEPLQLQERRSQLIWMKIQLTFNYKTASLEIKNTVDYQLTNTVLFTVLALCIYKYSSIYSSIIYTVLSSCSINTVLYTVLYTVLTECLYQYSSIYSSSWVSLSIQFYLSVFINTVLFSVFISLSIQFYIQFYLSVFTNTVLYTVLYTVLAECLYQYSSILSFLYWGPFYPVNFF
jgi:hypothetical protein